MMRLIRWLRSLLRSWKGHKVEEAVVVDIIARSVWVYNECPWDFDNPPEGMAQLQRMCAYDLAENIVRDLETRGYAIGEYW